MCTFSKIVCARNADTDATFRLSIINFKAVRLMPYNCLIAHNLRAILARCPLQIDSIIVAKWT